MDLRRVVLYSILALIVYNLWIAWQQDYPPVKVDSQLSATNSTPSTASSDLPMPHGEVIQTQNPNQEQASVDTSAPEIDKLADKQQLISVKTDVLSMKIDLAHGDIVEAKLLDYPVSVEQKNKPITLLNNSENETYIARSQMVALENKAPKPLKIEWQTAKSDYQLNTGDDQLTVTLVGRDKQGNQVKKHFYLKRGDYLVNVSYDFNNSTNTTKRIYQINQIVREQPKEDPSGLFHIGSFTGASYSNPGEKLYQKVSFKQMTKSNLNVKTQGGWIAMQQHYFLTAWVPEANQKNTIFTRSSNELYTIGLVGPSVAISPGKSHQFNQQIYIGPEITSVLKTIAPGLDMTIDYGLLWFLSSLLFAVMKAIHSVVGNWGWSIVLVTVLIKLAFYRLSATSYKSMANMRKLQPKLEALRQRYGDDKAKLSQETMALYRKEKINPLGGCLPILVQIPVFIALYWVLLESVELRQAPFIGWIQDLSVADPYHILPIIMGLTMLIQQKLNPAPPDPMQAKMMMFLPVVFTALFWGFPAGLVLYWIVNNTLSILQQWYITNKFSENKALKKLKKA
ncbi:membrane protein insertase YidC [Legionella sp. W05-934-2]|jgi:YidC/Oxa1 family membrane protein insertase|uniref:membrane protein insertase YidC n=1 Tax=Legionella sp. W05-934-2 TaxID=1198649 RepID=UPI0034617FE6